MSKLNFPYVPDLAALAADINGGIASDPQLDRRDTRRAQAALALLLERTRRAEAALEALRPFAQHDSSCTFAVDLQTQGPAAPRGQCSCGFDFVLDLLPSSYR